MTCQIYFCGCVAGRGIVDWLMQLNELLTLATSTYKLYVMVAGLP